MPPEPEAPDRDCGDEARRTAAWLAKVAHDLRNPLAPVRTATQLLRAASPDPQRPNEMLDLIERQLERMVRMLDDLAEFSRLRRGASEIAPQATDLASIVEGAVAQNAARIEAAGHVLHCHLPPYPMPIAGDPRELSRAVFRLVENAVRFSPEPGRITLQARTESSFVDLLVSDDGTGIPADQLAQAFELPTGLRASESLGVSLLLARACAERHGGSLTLRSPDGVNACTFVLRLPLVAEPAPQAR